jgi:hypothetical protein
MDDCLSQRDGIKPSTPSPASGYGAELVTHLRQALTILVEQFGRKRTRTNARRVGFHDTNHLIKETRT